MHRRLCEWYVPDTSFSLTLRTPAALHTHFVLWYCHLFTDVRFAAS